MVSEYLCVLVSMLICSAMLLIEVETCIQKTAHDLGKNCFVQVCVLVDRLSKEIMEECASNFVLCNVLSCDDIRKFNSKFECCRF